MRNLFVLLVFFLHSCATKKIFFEKINLLEDTISSENVVVYRPLIVTQGDTYMNDVVQINRNSVTRVSHIADTIHARLMEFLRNQKLVIGGVYSLQGGCFNQYNSLPKYKMPPFIEVDSIMKCAGFPFEDDKYRLFMYCGLSSSGGSNTGLWSMHMQAVVIRKDSILYLKDFDYSRQEPAFVKRSGNSRLEWYPPSQTTKVFRECLNEFFNLIK